MALYADRVKDSTSITGTGAITLSGTAPTGYQTFATAFGASPVTVAYCIADQSGPNWEVGTGTFNGTTGLTRTTVLASSNAGSPVNFTAGTKDVFCTAPAKYLDTFTSTSQGTVPASGGGTTNFLRADGTFAAPPSGSPASPTTSVQFNNAGAFGGSANFVYTTGTNTLTVGNITGITSSTGATAPGMSVILGAPSATQNGGALSVQTANATAATKSSGAVTLASGNGLTTGTSGAVNIKSGTSGTGSTGAVNISTGTTSGSRGNINLTSKYTYIDSTIYGNTTVTTPYGDWGGSLNIFGQDPSGFDYGGFINIKCGSGYYQAGDLNLTAGSAISGLGTGADVYLTAGDGFTGGAVYINAGNDNATGAAASYGGSVYIRAGTGASGSAGGSVNLIAGITNDIGLLCGDAGGEIVLNVSTDGTGQIRIGQYSGNSTILVKNQALGFFSTTPVAKQGTGTYTLAQVVSALQAYGLLV